MLPKPVTLWRIGDPQGAYPIWSGKGSAQYPGRWNRAGQEVIYTSDHLALAMLEKLAHNPLRQLPPNQHYIRITLPAGSSYERITPHNLRGWDAADQAVAQAFGADWFDQRRSLAMFVPSVLVPEAENVLINPLANGFSQIEVGPETRLAWDGRLIR